MRRGVVAVVALLIATAAGATFLLTNRPPAKGLNGAIALTANDANFASAQRASTTMAKVTDLLFAEGRACHARGATEAARPACQGRLAAGGFAQVAAVALQDCNAPTIFEVRAGYLRYLRAIRGLEGSAAAPLPEPPTIPPC